MARFSCLRNSHLVVGGKSGQTKQIKNKAPAGSTWLKKALRGNLSPRRGATGEKGGEKRKGGGKEGGGSEGGSSLSPQGRGISPRKLGSKEI